MDIFMNQSLGTSESFYNTTASIVSLTDIKEFLMVHFSEKCTIMKIEHEVYKPQKNTSGTKRFYLVIYFEKEKGFELVGSDNIPEFLRKRLNIKPIYRPTEDTKELFEKITSARVQTIHDTKGNAESICLVLDIRNIEGVLRFIFSRDLPNSKIYMGSIIEIEEENYLFNVIVRSLKEENKDE